MKNITHSVINGHIMVKLCAGIVHDKIISDAKQNPEVYTDVIDNVILLKFEFFHQKALNFKTLYLSNLWMKHDKNWQSD